MLFVLSRTLQRTDLELHREPDQLRYVVVHQKSSKRSARLLTVSEERLFHQRREADNCLKTALTLTLPAANLLSSAYRNIPSSMSGPGKWLISRQPGKAIWTVGAAFFTLINLSWWLICYIPRRWRQHPQWTYRQAIMNEMVRAILYHSSHVEVRTPVRLNEKDGFVTIHPSNDRYIYQGLLDEPDIQPTVVGGTWYPSPYRPGDEQTVILHFHGGAYTMGEGRPSDVEFLATTLIKNLKIKAKVLCLSYRLASNESCHFPAALQDAVTAYQNLVDQGISPNHIVVSGDSAGGGLVVSLLRHLSNDHGVSLPPPAAALLFSPWLDLKSARDRQDYVTGNKNHKTDYIPGNFVEWGARKYIPANQDARDPYFSPLEHAFLTKTLLWIHVGGLEVLYDEGIRFADAMKQKGNAVEVFVEPLANHDILYVGNLTGFAAQAEKGVRAAGEFIKRVGKK